MTRPTLLFALLAFADVAAGWSFKGVRGSSKLRPDVVARTLVQVEEKWRSQVDMFDDCNDSKGENIYAKHDCSTDSAAFQQSCSKVVSTVVASSGGDRDVVVEYMQDVCGQPSLEGWRREYCDGLASYLSNHMSVEAFDNRFAFDSTKVCAGYWTKLVEAEHGRLQKERDDRANEEKARMREQVEAARKELEEEKARREAEAKVEAQEKLEAEKAAQEKMAAEMAAEAKLQAEKEAKEALAAKSNEQKSNFTDGEAPTDDGNVTNNTLSKGEAATDVNASSGIVPAVAAHISNTAEVAEIPASTMTVSNASNASNSSVPAGPLNVTQTFF